MSEPPIVLTEWKRTPASWKEAHGWARDLAARGVAVQGVAPVYKVSMRRWSWAWWKRQIGRIRSWRRGQGSRN